MANEQATPAAPQAIPAAPTEVKGLLVSGAPRAGFSTSEFYKSGAVIAGSMGLAYEATAPTALRMAGLIVAGLSACYYGWLRTRAKGV